MWFNQLLRRLFVVVVYSHPRKQTFLSLLSSSFFRTRRQSTHIITHNFWFLLNHEKRKKTREERAESGLLLCCVCSSLQRPWDVLTTLDTHTHTLHKRENSSAITSSYFWHLKNGNEKLSCSSCSARVVAERSPSFFVRFNKGRHWRHLSITLP